MVLNQNEFVASLVNIIVKTRINDTTKGRRIYDLIDTALIDAQEYGEGAALLSQGARSFHKRPLPAFAHMSDGSEI